MRPGKSLRLAGVAGAFCAAAMPAAAQYRPAAAATQLAMPNAVPTEDRTYSKDEALLDLPLLWARAATLQEAVTVDADGNRQQLAAGTVLGAQRLVSASGVDVLRAFCTPRRASERAFDRQRQNASLARALLRGATDRQLCLVDSDRDGRFDQSLLVNAGPPEARVPRPMAPVAMTVAELVPISARDRIWVQLVGVDRRGASLTIVVHVQQQGHDRAFSRFGGRWGEVEARMRLRLNPTGPTDINILGVTMHVSAVDGAARTVRLRWTGHQDLARAIVVPDQTGSY